jgi:hypothetical protein
MDRKHFKFRVCVCLCVCIIEKSLTENPIRAIKDFSIKFQMEGEHRIYFQF